MADARVRQARRAGGYVLTPHGWRLATHAEPEEPGGDTQPARPDEDQAETPAAPEPTSEATGREREACPDCGKDVAVNKDGSLRKHTCVIEAPAPQVTFDDEGDGDGGNPAAEGW